MVLRKASDYPRFQVPFGATCFVFAVWMLQIGQMLGAESAGGVAEDIVGEKFAMFFCSGDLPWLPQ